MSQRSDDGPRPRGRPRDRSAEVTEAKVLEAAHAHFGMHGYAGARMIDIARTAGITHSSIYRYYPSKRALYEAAFDAAQRELVPAYLAALSGESTLRAQIKVFFRVAAAVNERRPEITPFLASIPLELRRQPELLEPLQAESGPLTTALAEIFAGARSRGEIPSTTDDLDLITAFIGSAMGIGLMAYGLPEHRMDGAVDILLATFDGVFFDDRTDPG